MRVVLTALFSERYPASGESHGLSVLAGQIRKDCSDLVESLDVLDMVAAGKDEREKLLSLIAKNSPHLIGISVSYGTFSKLIELVPLLKAAMPRGTQIVYGGPLATYLTEELLRKVDPDGIVFAGEGEIALVRFLRLGTHLEALHEIDNLAYLDADSAVIRTSRRLSAVDALAVPDRSHLKRLIPSGIQLYSEFSRGCSWAHCTFCLRGLLDIEGSGTEYRRMPANRLVADLRSIRGMGGAALTFADEDLLGGSIEQMRDCVEMLEHVMLEVGGDLRFDASVTVHSIYMTKRSAAEQTERIALLRRLRTLGLRKLFLGVESGSPSQLKRYAKGHSRDEAAEAIKLIRKEDVLVELGWILFDPLCSLVEIGENLEFLIECDAVEATSYLFNELRLQRGTSYERLLRTHELRTGVGLVENRFDPDTLSYSYQYANPEAGALAEVTRSWAEHLRPIHYPLKNLTRYGLSGAMDDQLDVPRRVLRDLRLGMCQALLAETRRAIPESEASRMATIEGFISDASCRLLAWADGISPALRQVELVHTLLESAETQITRSGLAENIQSASKA
jgi:radical SAM superfamily enzyme YgiQ (UPF0313 family)